jgi:hypothetical protein
MKKIGKAIYCDVILYLPYVKPGRCGARIDPQGGWEGITYKTAKIRIFPEPALNQ